MMTMTTLGMIAAIALPFSNVPMILKIRQRKSSQDISLLWTFGVFICLILMLPASLASTDPVFKAFGIVNVLFFSGVVFHVLRYRAGPPR